MSNPSLAQSFYRYASPSLVTPCSSADEGAMLATPYWLELATAISSDVQRLYFAQFSDLVAWLKAEQFKAHGRKVRPVATIGRWGFDRLRKGEIDPLQSVFCSDIVTGPRGALSATHWKVLDVLCLSIDDARKVAGNVFRHRGIVVTIEEIEKRI